MSLDPYREQPGRIQEIIESIGESTVRRHGGLLTDLVVFSMCVGSSV